MKQAEQLIEPDSPPANRKEQKPPKELKIDKSLNNNTTIFDKVDA